MEDKKITLRLNNRKQTGLGIVSFILGLVSLVLFLGAVGISAFADRTYNIVLAIGLMEMIGFIACIVGVIYGIMGEMKKDTFKTFAHIGMVINLILMLFHVMVIIYGFSG
ncbi:hypothetical protein SH1V18_44620 [Vallitalea longa]|uniref:Uncharacterized protein n=1 Tax=Vallitalea longa TaxID=2936439 RepID=A0A9W6DHV9_9FIRM|nr:DUF6142 family protein [Vallitalea longa]GKX31982.1 hypothetical protein SH1V18_44620 [Vallitalea longa]